jgi:hypothetical protein
VSGLGSLEDDEVPLEILERRARPLREMLRAPRPGDRWRTNPPHQRTATAASLESASRDVLAIRPGPRRPLGCLSRSRHLRCSKAPRTGSPSVAEGVRIAGPSIAWGGGCGRGKGEGAADVQRRCGHLRRAGVGVLGSVRCRDGGLTPWSSAISATGLSFIRARLNRATPELRRMWGRHCGLLSETIIASEQVSGLPGQAPPAFGFARSSHVSSNRGSRQPRG